jgi:Tol biopolymer transport system component
VPGDGISTTAQISGDGRLIAFYSYATNLVRGQADTNENSDVFVRDRLRGTTTRISVDERGRQADGGSIFPVMSADGRSVAFQSSAPNLVRRDTNDVYDVFVRQLRR